MRTIEQVKTIAVCGAGTMGAGIAQVAAVSGYNTILFDVQAGMPEKARQQISQQLDVLVGKSRMTVEEKEQVMSRLLFTGNIADCKADLIIEAIVEKADIKAAL